MIKTIYISNVLESFYRTYQKLATKKRLYWIRYDSMEGNRALFYNDDSKIILSPHPIHQKHFENTCKLMGWKKVFNLTPAHPTYSICEDCITDRYLKTQLIQLIKENPGIAIIPYRATPEFHRLVAYLHRRNLQFITPETLPINKEFINTYCHCKRGFRHFWSRAMPNHNHLKIDVPLGFITGNKEEAIEAAWWFQQQDRSFVIKYNKGTQGIGILLNYHTKFSYNKQKFTNQLRSLLTDKIWDEPSIIVEELICREKTELGGSPSIEFFINEGGKVIPTYGCEQVLGEDKKTFRGVYIHPEIMNNKHIKNAFKAGKHFGEELAVLGYRGHFDIDLVISKDDKLYAVESNLRRTGGTHVHEMAVSLLGKNYWQSFHVVGEDIILQKNSHLTYEKCADLLKDLIFNKKVQTGFIFCNPDMLQVDILNAIFIGRSKKEIDRLRRQTKKRLWIKTS